MPHDVGGGDDAGRMAGGGAAAGAGGGTGHRRVLHRSPLHQQVQETTEYRLLSEWSHTGIIFIEFEFDPDKINKIFIDSTTQAYKWVRNCNNLLLKRLYLHSWAPRKLSPLSPLSPLNIWLSINGPLISF